MKVVVEPTFDGVYVVARSEYPERTLEAVRVRLGPLFDLRIALAKRRGGRLHRRSERRQRRLNEAMRRHG